MHWHKYLDHFLKVQFLSSEKGFCLKAKFGLKSEYLCVYTGNLDIQCGNF